MKPQLLLPIPDCLPVCKACDLVISEFPYVSGQGEDYHTECWNKIINEVLNNNFLGPNPRLK